MILSLSNPEADTNNFLCWDSTPSSIFNCEVKLLIIPDRFFKDSRGTLTCVLKSLYGVRDQFNTSPSEKILLGTQIILLSSLRILVSKYVISSMTPMIVHYIKHAYSFMLMVLVNVYLYVIVCMVYILCARIE